MTPIQSIIIGIVEGVTEFLPISSTAHIEIASQLLHVIQTDFVKSFDIIIQAGAILAVVVFFANRFKKSKKIWLRVLAAFIPTALIGFVLYKFIKNYLLGNFTIIAWALLLGGIIIILFELFHKDRTDIQNITEELENMPYSHAVIIGIAQSIAVIPGVSRSGATIISGLSLGISRAAIVEFSFLLAVPTMLAASGYDLLKTSGHFSGSEYGILAIGFIASFISALLAIRFFVDFIQKHSFISFGVYRIILAIIIFVSL